MMHGMCWTVGSGWGLGLGLGIGMEDGDGDGDVWLIPQRPQGLAGPG
jgi:hypothetical protein